MIELWVGLGVYALIGFAMFIALTSKRLDLIELARGKQPDAPELGAGDIVGCALGGAFWPVVLLAKLLSKML